jgi:16S rRNA (uracil1498-N3)-methyltransferase
MSGEPWFFAPAEEWSDSSIRLPEDETRHATKVLRVAPPDVITVTDGLGSVARCAVSTLEDDRLSVEILERDRRRRARPDIVVYQGAAKGAKTDVLTEKLAALGVAELSIFRSERTVVNWDDAKLDKHMERWTAIARSAAKQSRNPYLMNVGDPLPWSGLVEAVRKEPFTIVLWEDAWLPMRAALIGQSDRVAVVVGPEGGLARAEAEQLADAGGQLCSLGPRILRTEDAPVVATSALLYHYGLIG